MEPEPSTPGGDDELTAPPQTDRSTWRTRLLAIAVGAVVVVGLAVVLIIRATALPTDPHGIAEGVAQAMAHEDPSDLAPYYCSDDEPGHQQPEKAVYDAGQYEVGTETYVGKDLVTSPEYCDEAFPDVPHY